MKCVAPELAHAFLLSLTTFTTSNELSLSFAKSLSLDEGLDGGATAVDGCELSGCMLARAQ